MSTGTRKAVQYASLVSLGGFLFGFDASVISGVVGFIAPRFGLNEWQLGLVLVGLTNSLSSFLVQFVFPWELANFGNALTFFIYSLLGLIALVLLARLLPETKGQSLEQLEALLVRG